MKLPFATFLIGNRLQCQVLAASLSAADGELMRVSLRTPIEAALCATFFENDPSLAIHDKLALPINDEGTTFTADYFVKEYKRFLQDTYGFNVLAKLALRAIEENADYFERFLIEDASLLEINTMTERFGRNRCLALDLSQTLSPNDLPFRTLGLPETTTASDLTAILESTP